MKNHNIRHTLLLTVALALLSAIIPCCTTAQTATQRRTVYDFIVPDSGTFRQAIAAANTRQDTARRYRIFIRRGTYSVPPSQTETVKGNDGQTYPSPITVLTAPNVSIIGEDRDGTVVVNEVPDVTYETKWGPSNVLEGLHRCETFLIDRQCHDTYLQDLTLRNALKDRTGRGAALEDKGDRTICMNVTLHGYQDTYYSGNVCGRFYFEGGKIRGRTDFLCGKGDVFFNRVEMVMCDAGYLAVPSTPRRYGYVLRDCTVKGEKLPVDGKYTLGRPWGKGGPTARYINTRLEAVPSQEGWSEMSGGWPARFAEYNSTNARGRKTSLSKRKTVFGDNHQNNPVMTKAEADSLTVDAVMGGDDGWQPQKHTAQATIPQRVRMKGNRLTWKSDPSALCWAVCRDGKVVAFTLTNAFTLTDRRGTYTVRAANQMGGLSDPAGL